MSSTICMYSSSDCRLGSTQDNTDRIAFKTITSLDLKAVSSHSTQAHVAIKAQLTVGKCVHAGILFQHALNKNGIKIFFLLLMESFEQCSDLLPRDSPGIDNAHNLFPPISDSTFHH